MKSDRIDKSIAQVRLSNMVLILASLVILSISLFVGRGIGHRAATNLDTIIGIQATWPQNIPDRFTNLVSDITIPSDVFIASLGYVAFHGSSPFASIFGKDQVFLSGEKHNAVILDASSYQKNALDDLQLLYSSPPLTLEDFRRSWNYLAFPIYFMQFGSIYNWYLGTPDEVNIVWWDRVKQEAGVPIVPNNARPEKSVSLALSNRESQWDIMGNMWRGEDSSSDMKSDLNNNDGWFLYAEYEVNGKQHKLVGVLGKPILIRVFPLKFIPGHEFDLSSATPFSIAFPWISEYEDRFNQATLEQLKQYLSINEELEKRHVSLFGISVAQKQALLFAVPILLIIQIHILAQILGMIAYFRNRGHNENSEYSDSEPWLNFSDSKEAFFYYLIAFYATPAAAAAVSTLVGYSEEDQWWAIFLSTFVFIVSAVLIHKSILLRRLRLSALNTASA